MRFLSILAAGATLLGVASAVYDDTILRIKPYEGKGATVEAPEDQCVSFPDNIEEESWKILYVQTPNADDPVRCTVYAKVGCRGARTAFKRGLHKFKEEKSFRGASARCVTDAIDDREEF
ncbi:hypothetical protein ASPWEDRAFT_183826 [Aspergillus wentii DTO 134E9]|uniref:Uncharacterized protein n=1 Tax=Aspergillus wentii DTO 134E9 TaxID=1073089 RepID=A0A1L9RLL2_ASPWE|nr:uncharacterized protein ASPWEDRAFT_183826 [Aspergillus wentii DTO 134E9]KAI9929730.1 hypothetical protein MW887_001206 [Aspergillus wentii]OJJ35812.1 hypothetical protein ASPWEDRAFT_183826 [Aspergillus wentii DTO 134E9]